MFFVLLPTLGAGCGKGRVNGSGDDPCAAESVTDACLGRVCGLTPCGASCGTCDVGETCDSAGQCTIGCVPADGLTPPVTILATRTSGTAPLAVVFDVADYDSGETSQPFFDNEVVWDFDDNGSGNYLYGNQESRNSAFGPIAAKTFENPGTYNVTVLIRLPSSGTFVSGSITITVNDPNVVYSGTNTVAISRNGDFTDAPPGADLVTTSSWATVRSYLNANTRVLLRRGEAAWTADATHNFSTSNTGGTLGAFGPGATPTINTTVDLFTYVGNDWRIMDLNFVDVTPHGAIFVQDPGVPNSYARNLLIFRCLIQDFNSVNQIGLLQAGAPGWDGGNHGPLYWFENRIIHPFNPAGHTTGQWLSAADNLAVVGCEYQHPADDHFGMRHAWIRRSVFSNITHYGNQDPTQSPFRIHAPFWDSTNDNYDFNYTEKVLVSGCHFDVENGSPIRMNTVNIGDSRFRHILVERNLLQRSNNTNAGPLIDIGTANTTGEDTLHARANICVRASGGDCFEIERVGANTPALHPTGVRIYRNTFFNTATLGTWNANFIDTGIAAGEVTIHSNFIHAANVSTINVALDNSAGADIDDNVIANDAASNHFVSVPPSAPDDFALRSGSPSIDAGRTGQSEHYQFDGTRLYDGTTLDCGAWEHGVAPGLTCGSI